MRPMMLHALYQSFARLLILLAWTLGYGLQEMQQTKWDTFARQFKFEDGRYCHHVHSVQ